MGNNARPSRIKRALAPAWVRPEHLNVAPELLGAPLAPNVRRALAMGIDVALIGLLSTTGMFWSVAGAGALAIQLRRKTPRRPLWRSVLMWLALAWLVVVAYAHAANWLAHHNDPKQLVAALKDDDDDEAEDAPSAASAPASAPMAAASAVASAAGADADLAARQSARIEKLEAQLAEARKSHPMQWRDELQRRLHKVGLRFGWAIAYFTLLPTWWRGQTVGKRLFGLRVVHLTGRQMGLMDSFGRYGGYAAGLATGGIGLLQVLWDPNRQAVEDKLAHTVVVDLRGPRLATIATPPAIALEDA
jgi:uncharacterized RDD family membrane protein YckC